MIIAAAVLASAVACTKEIEEPSALDGKVQMSFAVSTEQTKTVLEGANKTFWTGVEKLSIFDGESNNLFAAELATPSATAAALAALRVLKSHPELPERVMSLGDYCRKAFKDRDLIVKESQTPIIPLPSKDAITTATVNKMLYERGVFVNCVFPPAVDPDDCLIRVSLMANITEALIDEAADIIHDVFKEVGLLKSQQK